MAVLGPGAGQVLLGLSFLSVLQGARLGDSGKQRVAKPRPSAPRTHAGRAWTVAVVSVFGASPRSCGPVGGGPREAVETFLGLGATNVARESGYQRETFV